MAEGKFSRNWHNSYTAVHEGSEWLPGDHLKISLPIFIITCNQHVRKNITVSLNWFYVLPEKQKKLRFLSKGQGILAPKECYRSGPASCALLPRKTGGCWGRNSPCWVSRFRKWYSWYIIKILNALWGGTFCWGGNSHFCGRFPPIKTFHAEFYILFVLGVNLKLVKKGSQTFKKECKNAFIHVQF